jgi:xylulokinase
MDYVLGFDLGTSYFKLGLFNKKGELCGLGRVYISKDVGDGSRSEVPIDRFWKLLQHGLQDACQQAQILPNRIKAVSYSSQANSFVLLDKNKNPLTPIILWCDNRAEGGKNIQHIFFHERFLEKSGLGIECSHQFCVSKLLWFQQHRPDLWSQAAYVMTISDYFTYSLTGQIVGDAGTASLLGLLNIHTMEWQKHIIDLSNIQFSNQLLPGTVAGRISKKGATLLGLKTNIPFVVGSLDHHMAGIGAGLGYIADMSESTGTVLACLKLATEFAPEKNICTGTGLKRDHYYQLTFEKNGAGALEWYQKNYATEHSISDLERLAIDVEIGSEGLIAKPNAQKYPELEGFINKSSVHQHAHFIRALLESTAFSLVKLVQQLSGSFLPKRIVATGGGAKNDLWLQIKSDLLGVEFITTKTQEPACLGAAMLASITAGWYPDIKTVIQHWVKINKSFQPIPDNQTKYVELYKKMKLVE